MKNIFATMLLLLMIIIATSFINHKVQLSKEEAIFIPSGQMLEVNGHKMHIYTEGKGADTLVFMAGGGTSSPFLDFKSLYSLLSDKYKVVVVEKSGYGFSEDADVDRDIDTILEETRQVLSQAQIEGPFILFPHSMSGIEALYWAQEYPEEVKGIIGLDMTVPKAYEDYKVNNAVLKAGSFGARVGITRFFPSIVDSSAAIKYGTLDEEEKELYRAVFYRRTSTRSMMREVKSIKENANKIKSNYKPSIPVLFFTSNGDETGWDNNEWIDLQALYIDNIKIGKIIKLDCSHYIHDIEYEIIAEESNKFIEEVIN